MTTVRPLFTPLLTLAAVSLFTVCSQAYADISISSGDGVLSVKADNVSASELAAELSDQLGISVVVTGKADTQINVDIVDEPLEIALGNLSPNNMLVRNSEGTEITEVVLMMGEGDNNSSAGGSSDQFLPSGSPAEEVQAEQTSEQQPAATDQSNQASGSAASTSNDPNVPPEQVPPMYAEDGREIDPATGLPREQQ